MKLLEALIDNDPILPTTGRRELFIAIRTDGVIGDGTEDSPFNGSTDVLLDSLFEILIAAENITYRFGPGIFQTKGSGGKDFGFRPRNGCRFVGSGMFQTTLQVVKRTSVGPHY